MSVMLQAKLVVLSIQLCIRPKIIKDGDLHHIVKHSTVEDILKCLLSGKL